MELKALAPRLKRSLIAEMLSIGNFWWVVSSILGICSEVIWPAR